MPAFAQLNLAGAYHRTITIDHTKVAGSGQVNFPVLISGTYSYLAGTANGGQVQSPNGYDILFSSDAAGQNLLNYEIESYDSATGAITAWVQIPNLSSTDDTTIYMTYGISGITSFQGNAAGTWNSNYAGVWHLGSSGGTLNTNDSTVNGNNGVNTNVTSVPGQIGSAGSFDGTSASIGLGSANLWPSGVGTASVWAKMASTGVANNYLLAYGDDNGAQSWGIDVIPQGNSSSTNVAFLYGSARWVGSTANFDPTAWHLYTVVATASNAQYVYVDDTLISSGTDSVISPASGMGMNIGTTDRGAPYSYLTNGNLDEVHVLTTPLSSSWIATEYANQSSPSTFYSVGSQSRGQLRTITIDHTKVAGSGQVNFPVLISGTYSYLAGTANGGQVQSSNGYDILFSSDPAGQNLLNYEIESYDSTTGAITAWVQIPNLSSTADTTIYMTYGISGVTSFQGNAAATWNSNYAGVWHLGSSGGALNTNDSTTNGNNGANTNVTSVSGQIGSAGSFDGTSASIGLGSANLWPSGVGTASVWAKMASTGVANNYLLAYGDDNGAQSWGIDVIPQGTSNSTAVAFLYGSARWVGSTANFDPTAWHLYTVVATASNTQSVYVDGTLVSSGTDSVISPATGMGMNIGKTDRASPYQYFTNGNLDEVHVLTAPLSSSWIATEYANQSSPGTFYSVANAAGSSAGPSINPLGVAVAVGNSLTISGSSLGSSGTVTFSGSAPVAASNWSSNTITVTVPATAITGPVYITTASGAASNRSFVTIIPAPPPALSWNPPTTIAYGVPLSNVQLNATAGVQGIFTYSPNIGYVFPSVGFAHLTAIFTPIDTAHYATSTLTATLTVTKGTPTITWATPNPIAGGTPLTGAQLNATANVPGNFTYSPAAGTMPTAHSETLTVVFTPDDQVDYTTATASVVLTTTGALNDIVQVVAGDGITGDTNDGGPALQAEISTGPFTRDSNGNLYFIDPQRSVVRMVDTSGKITVVAGNGQGGTHPNGSPDGPTALQTELDNPVSIAADSSGNIYISEQWGCLLRKVNPSTGFVQTISATSGCLGGTPLAADIQGNIYGWQLSTPSWACNQNISNPGVCLYQLNTVTNQMEIVAGNGAAGYSQDGTLATNASLSLGGSIAVDGNGNIYFIDNGPNQNQVLRRIDHITKTISTVGPSLCSGFCRTMGPEAMTIDSSGNIWFTQYNGQQTFLDKINVTTGIETLMAGAISGASPVTGIDYRSLDYGNVTAMAFDSSNDLYVADGNVIFNVANPKASTMITWPAPPTPVNQTVLTGAQLDATATGGATVLNAASPVAGTMMYSPPAGTVITTLPFPLSVNFVPDDPGTFEPSNATQTIGPGANQWTPVISWSPAALTYGAPISVAQLNATAYYPAYPTSPMPGSYVYSVAEGTKLNVGTYIVTLTFTPDYSYYGPVYVSAQIAVAQATPAISWPPPRPIRSGEPLTSTQLDATASVPGTFTYSPTLGTVPPQGLNTLSVTFTPNDNNYQSTSTTTTLTVNSAMPAPVIRNITPDPVAVGSTVTITGSGFGATQGVSTVMFKGYLGAPTSWSDNEIIVPVPAGASTGNVVVWNGNNPSNNFLLMISAVCP